MDEWSACRTDPYLTKQNTHNKDINGPTGIRTKNLSMRGPQTNALDRTATETGFYALYSLLSTWRGARTNGMCTVIQ